jgi:quinol monooxygenase YgiN
LTNSINLTYIYVKGGYKIMADKKLTIVACVKAKPGKLEEVKKELMHLVVETHKEPGCINYDCHIKEDDPSSFLFYENWVNRAEWEKHMEMPYLKKWIDELAPELCEDSPDITLWEMQEPPAE